jgi:P4 family phage/plasmid primase-like protien
MTTIQITQGLYTVKPTPIDICSDCVEDYVKSNGDLYEMLYWKDKKVRAFIDIDGCMEKTTTEEEFNITNEMILNILSDFDEWESPVSITTSSKYNAQMWDNNKKTTYVKHKLSYGVVFLEKYGSNRAIKQWTQGVIAPKLKEALAIAIPFYIKGVDKDIPDEGLLDYDNSVYDKNRRMRCVFTSKPNENRPRIIYSNHSVLDTMITYVPENCQALPEPEPEPVLANPIITPSPEETVVEDILHRVVMGLAKSRCDDRKDWLSVGMILYNEGYDVTTWELFSKQSPKYRWGECQRLWRGFHKGTLTQRSLWKMLKEDNPVLFKELWEQNKAKEKAYLQLLEGGHRGMAEHFVNCKSDDYLYHEKSGWWYLASNKMWVNTNNKTPSTLLTIVSRTLFQECDEIGNIYRKKVLEEESDEKSDSWNKTMLKKTLDARKSLLQTGFVKSIIEFCQSLYAEQTILLLEKYQVDCLHKLMDCNPMLFAFTDAVYDFTKVAGEVMGKRPIQPTDFITTSCGYAYPTLNQQVKQQVEDCLKTIWSIQTAVDDDGEVRTCGDDNETYEYAMKMLATTLCGVRWAEAFYILTGSGRNGKGLLFELVHRVMGNYYYTAPIQVLTTKLTDSTSANPEAFNMKGKHLVCCSEPEASEKLQEGTVKYYTGGDEITGRALWGNPIKFKPHFGLFLQCNNVPLFNGITRAGVLRNVLIPFPFEFVNNPKTVREKKGNADIKNRLCKSDEWRDAMWFVLLERFESIREKALDAIPKSKLVEERTEEYIAENNAVGAWWEQKYERDAKSWVQTKKAYRAYLSDTGNQITDKKFAEALRFNMFEPKQITTGENKGTMGVKGWKEKVEEEKENVPQ